MWSTGVSHRVEAVNIWVHLAFLGFFRAPHPPANIDVGFLSDSEPGPLVYLIKTVLCFCFRVSMV